MTDSRFLMRLVKEADTLVNDNHDPELEGLDNIIHMKVDEVEELRVAYEEIRLQIENSRYVLCNITEKMLAVQADLLRLMSERTRCFQSKMKSRL